MATKQKTAARQAHQNAAKAAQARRAAKKMPVFTSFDGVLVIEHKPVGAEAFMTIKALPAKFTDVMKRVYEATVNGEKIDVAKAQKPEERMTADEFTEMLRNLMVELAVNPRFHNDAEDLEQNILNVMDWQEYWMEFYNYLFGSARPVMAAGEVSDKSLETFPDGAQQS